MTTGRWGWAIALAVVVAFGTTTDATAQKRRRRPPKPERAAISVAVEAAALRGADDEAALRAAGTLAGARGESAVQALLDALALGLTPRVAVAALSALERLADPAAFDVLAHFAHYRDPLVRAAAVSALGALDDPRVDMAILAALRDFEQGVRAAAARAITRRRVGSAVEPLLALTIKGDSAAAAALAALDDPAVARAVAELVGRAPTPLVASSLGQMLLRPDFGPEEARVAVVRALASLPGSESLEQLTTYVGAGPETPATASRMEAAAAIARRLQGDQ